MSKNECLKKLETWLKRRGYSFVVRNDLPWFVNIREKTIYGNNVDFQGMEKVAVLLHECGHIIRLGKKYTPPRQPPMEAPKSGKPTDSWYIGFVHEEMDAWDEAARLASRLGLKGVRAAMIRTRERCLMGYMMWASSRGDHKWMSAAVHKSRAKTKQEKKK